MSQPPAPHPIHSASSAGAIPMTPTDLNVNSYYPEPPSDLTGGLPINLDSLRDGPPGSKPFYPYSTLIRCVCCLVLCVALRDNGSSHHTRSLFVFVLGTL